MTLSDITAISPYQAIFTPEQISSNILDFKIQTHPYVSYVMSGVNITAYITPTLTDSGSVFTVSSNSGSVNRIVVLGNKQIIGKDGYVSTISDITTDSVINIKNTIRKNVMVNLRGRTPDLASSSAPTIIRGIKYIK